MGPYRRGINKQTTTYEIDATSNEGSYVYGVIKCEYRINTQSIIRTKLIECFVVLFNHKWNTAFYSHPPKDGHIHVTVQNVSDSHLF